MTQGGGRAGKVEGVSAAARAGGLEDWKEDALGMVEIGALLLPSGVTHHL